MKMIFEVIAHAWAFFLELTRIGMMLVKAGFFFAVAGLFAWFAYQMFKGL